MALPPYLRLSLFPGFFLGRLLPLACLVAGILICRGLAAEPQAEIVPAPDAASRGDSVPTEPDYHVLRNKLAAGVATLAEVRTALTEPDPAGISNTMHALYSLHWNRMIYPLYDDLWNLSKQAHPEFAWRAIESVPARIALASTLARVRGGDEAGQLLAYIRSHRYDDHEFHRAQAVVALALNADPDDLDYIIEMAASDNAYVGRSAAAGLALSGLPRARDELIRLWRRQQDPDGKEYLARLLWRAYAWGEDRSGSRPAAVKPGTIKRLR